MGLFGNLVEPEEAGIAMGGLHTGAGASPDRRVLLQALREGFDDVIRSYMSSHPEYLQQMSFEEQPLIHLCARYGREELISYLLNLSIDVNLLNKDLQTTLHVASKHGQSKCIEALLHTSIDVDAQDSDGCTALHLAIKNGHIVDAVTLISYTVKSIHAVDGNLRTPLHDAVLCGSVHLCNALMKIGVSTAVKDVCGCTPLMLACSRGYEDITICLLKTLECRNQMYLGVDMIAAEDNQGASALHYAVDSNHLPVVHTLIKYAVDINKAKNCGTTAMHIAASAGYVTSLRTLLEHGAAINVIDKESYTPLHKATILNKLECVELLIAKKASVDSKDASGMCPSHHAASRGHAAILKCLLEHGAQLLATDELMKTPLHCAVLGGHSLCVDILTTFAANVSNNCLTSLLSANDTDGFTAAHHAATRADGATMLTSLLQSGDVSYLQRDGAMRTLLHLAAEHNCCDNMAMILDRCKRLELTMTDNEGRTPLHLACQRGCKEAVRLLLSRGTTISIRDCSGKTALLHAAAGGHVEVTKLLLLSGADIATVDGLKNTALHLACTSNTVDVVQLLLDVDASLTARNAAGDTPLEVSIARNAKHSATTIVKHARWETAMSATDAQGFTPKERMTRSMPSVASVVMDRCITLKNDPDSAKHEIIYNYKYIDPHPDDPCCRQRKQWFIKTMASLKQQDLLFHRLAQSNIQWKWLKFGRTVHYTRFGIFIVFLALLTAYTFIAPSINMDYQLDKYGCTIQLNSSDSNNSALIAEYQQNGQSSATYQISSDRSYETLIQVILFSISVFYTVQEVAMMVVLRQGYFIKAGNYLTLVTIGTTLGFIVPLASLPCLYQWRCGWLANLFSWTSLMFFLGSFDFIGIYVIMLTTVVKSLLKVMLLLLVFFLGFAIVFFILVNSETQFASLGISLLSVLDMANGEIAFSSNFLAATSHFATDSLYAITFFMFMVNIVLINLTIGVTLGDIDAMRVSAKLQMVTQKIELLYHYEANFPLSIRRRWHTKEHVHSPNSGSGSLIATAVKAVNLYISIPEVEEKSEQSDGNDLSETLRAIQSELAGLRKLVAGQQTLLHTVTAQTKRSSSQEGHSS